MSLVLSVIMVFGFKLHGVLYAIVALTGGTAIALLTVYLLKGKK